MAPPWGLSTTRASKELFPKFPKSNLVTKYVVFLKDLYHIFHGRSCNHFQWFPHTPMPPRPLKRPQNSDLLLDSPPHYFSILLKSPWSYRSLVPPWGHIVSVFGKSFLEEQLDTFLIDLLSLMSQSLRHAGGLGRRPLDKHSISSIKTKMYKHER